MFRFRSKFEKEIMKGYGPMIPNHVTANRPPVNNIQTVIIKPEALDITQIQEGDGNAHEFRPFTWDQYISQETAKKRLQSYIAGCKAFGEVFPHTFLSSPPGHGKTLLSMILAQELQKKLVVAVAGEIKSEQQFIDKLTECNGGILFIDEANRINKRVGFFALPILEQFEIQSKKLKPFTCILATTHKGDLAKDMDALIQRFPLQIELESYNIQDLVRILKQFEVKQYGKESIDNDTLIQIASNCRQTPRIAIHLLKEFMYIKNWKQVQDNNNIIVDGLTETDIRALTYIRQYDGAGKESIAKFLRVKGTTYEWEIEPYLIFRELLHIAGKRKITQKGTDLLISLKKRIKVQL